MNFARNKLFNLDPEPARPNRQNPRWMIFTQRVALLCVWILACMSALLVPRSVNAKHVLRAATTVVISEFRTRGPNGGNDEFIELFNATSASVDISGWKIRASNSAGATNPRAIIPSGTVLASGGHYLIANSSAGGYSGSVPANLTYSTGITDDGGIALTLPDDTPLDQVGMSSGSTYKEGSFLSPLSGTSNQSYERIADNFGACTDANNNFIDFFLRSPSDPQNMASSITICGNPTPTTTASNTVPPTPTASSTNTFVPIDTSTPTLALTLTGTLPFLTTTPTSAATAVPNLAVIINEVAWMGTGASSSDEWIELYNPGSVTIDLTGWQLKSDDASPTIVWTSADNVLIAPGAYYLLERTDDTTISDVTADKIYSGELVNGGETLRLSDPSGNTVDTANADGGGWPAGAEAARGSMERIGVAPDGLLAWASNIGLVRNGLDANGNPINGTPRQPNWASSVTLTPSPTITPTRTPSATRTIKPSATAQRIATTRPMGQPIINEFLPRPGFDWNQDGRIDVFDEFIEIKNIGAFDVDLSGWKLDDAANSGSDPFSLPAIMLKPGQRALFYGLQTDILLSDGGDSVRLLNPSGQVVDSYTYSFARAEDQAICRLPDGHGPWYEGCAPTPNESNTLTGKVPSLPVGRDESSTCDLPDTLPEDFLLAECRGPGADIWSAAYWDGKGVNSTRNIPENSGKWESFVE